MPEVPTASAHDAGRHTVRWIVIAAVVVVLVAALAYAFRTAGNAPETAPPDSSAKASTIPTVGAPASIAGTRRGDDSTPPSKNAEPASD